MKVSQHICIEKKQVISLHNMQYMMSLEFRERLFTLRGEMLLTNDTAYIQSANMPEMFSNNCKMV